MSVSHADNESLLHQGDENALRHDEAQRPTSRLGMVPAGIWKVVVFLWKYFVAVLLCQTFVGSIFVVGWTYRLMQRAALKTWWKKSHFRRSGETFVAFLSQSESFGQLKRWPNWILGQHPTIASALRPQWYSVLFGSLWTNGKLGIQAIFNTWVLTLPACILWLFAWFAGWNNSFHKGYEQATVGPLTGLLGVALFIAAMFYVPIAQARQATTGSWVAFYDFRLVWRLVRNRWFGCLKLAVLYSMLSLPVIILKTAPGFFPQINPALENATDADILQILNWYYFAAAAVVFVIFFYLKLSATRTYAAALLHSLSKGDVSPDDLHPTEQSALAELGLLQAPETRQRHLILRTVTGSGRVFKAVTIGLATTIVWFTFVSQIYVSEFLNYHPIDNKGHFLGGWLNQPLVQLPWFNYTPGDLRERVETGRPTEMSADRDAVI